MATVLSTDGEMTCYAGTLSKIKNKNKNLEILKTHMQVTKNR